MQLGQETTPNDLNTHIKGGRYLLIQITEQLRGRCGFKQIFIEAQRYAQVPVSPHFLFVLPSYWSHSQLCPRLEAPSSLLRTPGTTGFLAHNQWRRGPVTPNSQQESSGSLWSECLSHCPFLNGLLWPGEGGHAWASVNQSHPQSQWYPSQTSAELGRATSQRKLRQLSQEGGQGRRGNLAPWSQINQKAGQTKDFESI